MHWLDRMTTAFAPRWTVRRMRARMAAELLARHYEAASPGRRTQGWRRASGDANAVIASALAPLRMHARDLVRNDGYAESALDTIRDHTVGWGIVAKCAKGTPADIRTKAEAAWRAWAETKACDADGLQNLYGLQKLVIGTVAESGECLVRRRWRRLDDGFPIPVQLQVLEPDYLDTTKDTLGANGNKIINGIEYNAFGQRTAYWLFRDHPGSVGSLGGASSFTGNSVPVPASEVLHIFNRKRAGQNRGPSWFAPVILKLKDFSEYEDAALMKQKIAACLAVLTTDVDGSNPALGIADPLGKPGEVDQLEPGMIASIAPGRSITVVDPPSVNEHATYSMTVLRAISAGLGITYEDMTGDYCIAPETRVLRADLRWVRADTLQVGDEIVGFDENRPGPHKFRCHRKATVVRAGRRNLPRIAVKTDRLAVSVSTDHAFLCIRPTKGTGTKWKMHQWVRAEDLIPGDKIAFLTEPWEDGVSHTHGYLKGIADGEGCVDRCRVSISQKPGPVFDEIGAALKSLGFTITNRGPANGQSRCGGLRSTHEWELGRLTYALRFLGEVRPTRLLGLAQRVYEGVAIAGGHGKRGTYATVLSAEPEGVGPVVTLETSTHTVITEGLYSHNTNLPFSAARMSRLKHWARVYDWRWQVLIPMFCEPVWQWAMEAASISPGLGLQGRPRPNSTWTAPPPPMLEPDKEGLAYSRNIRNGITTLSESIREQGRDRDEVLDEMAEDWKEVDRRKLILDCDPRMTTQQGNPRETAKAAAATASSNGTGRPVPAGAANGNGRSH